MKGLLIFVGGFAAGIAATFIYVKKKIVPDIREEVEKQYKKEDENDIFGSLSASYSGDYDLDITNEPAKVSPEKRKEAHKPSKDYTKCFKDEKKPEVKSNTETNFEAKDIKAGEPSSASASGVGPYIIDAGEFDNYSDYHARTFIFYSDGVVLEDEEEEILDADPEIVFGKNALEELNKPENRGIVYVRNDETKSDYCLELRPYPFDGFESSGPGDDWR